MMLADADLFVLYRWLLAIAGTVYTLVCTGRSLYGWLAYFSSSRHTAILGRYTGVLLLRIRARHLAWEFCQISVLLAVLGYVIYLHRAVTQTM